MPHDHRPTPAAAAPVDAAVSGLRVGLALTGLGVTELWLGYLGIGGDLSRAEIDATLAGTRPDDEHDVLAQALNDHLIGSDLAYRVPFRHELIALTR